MVASSLSRDGSQRARQLIQQASIPKEQPGSEDYQQNHMAMIFDQGLSFSGFERNKLFISAGGRYVDLSDLSGADSEMDGRAVLAADFDDDGDEDLFVSSTQREGFMLYRNDLARPLRGGFLKLHLRASRGARDAIGAIVKVRSGGRVQARVVSCGGGFESENPLELVFGLGKAAGGEVSVHWPGRATESFGVLKAGSRSLLQEGSGRPQPLQSHTFHFPDPLPPGLRVRLGTSFPGLAVTDLKGTKEHLQAGPKPLLLTFWATTCGACLHEMPLLLKLQREGRFQVRAVSLDPPGRKAAIRTVVERVAPGLQVRLAAAADVGRILDLARTAIPLSLLVAPDGTLKRVLVGRLKEKDL